MTTDATLATSDFKHCTIRVKVPPPLFVLTEINQNRAAFVRGYCDDKIVYIQNDHYLSPSWRKARAETEKRK